MHKDILKANPSPNLRVYAVWFSMIPTDARSRWGWTGGILDDPRVVHYWDENKKVGRFFANKDADTDDPDVVWDAYYLYGSEAQWLTKPEPLVSTGATILDEFDGLKNGLTPLLK